MYFILISTAIIVLLTIGSGVYLLYNNTDSSKTKLKKALRTNLFAIIPCLVMAFVFLMPNSAFAESAAGASNGLGLLAAALSTGLATITDWLFQFLFCNNYNYEIRNYKCG